MCLRFLLFSRVSPAKTSWRGGRIPLTMPVQENCIYFWVRLLHPTHVRFPPECLVTSFSQRTLCTCVLCHLYLSCGHSEIKIPEKKVCWGLVRKATDAECRPKYKSGGFSVRHRGFPYLDSLQQDLLSKLAASLNCGNSINSWLILNFHYGSTSCHIESFWFDVCLIFSPEDNCGKFPRIKSGSFVLFQK